MKHYLHRISHRKEWSHPLLDHRNLLSIGWSAFGSQPDFLGQHQHDWSEVPSTIERECGKFKSRFGLQRFLQMEQGDRVLIPTWGAFHVYRVADNHRLVPVDIVNHLKDLKSWNDKNAVIRDRCIVEQNGEEPKPVDLGFFRRVEPLERDIPRAGYADAALTSRMKVRQTNVEITDLCSQVEDAIARYRSKSPISVRTLVMKRCASEVRNIVLEHLAPDQFETLIARYFKRQGASTEIPAKNAGDKEGDADIIATFESLKVIVYVQAKCHNGETDGWAVEQVRRFVEYQSDNGEDDDFTRLSWVVSTAETFSEDCYEKARCGRVRLVDGLKFAEMLLDVGIEHL